MHPHQLPLEPGISEIWVEALADAQFDPEDALLFVFEGPGPGGLHGYCLQRSRTIISTPEVPQLDALLEQLNAEACIHAIKVLLWNGERGVEELAAVVRHELEHARQFDAHADRLIQLHGVVQCVLAERVGSLPGGALLYTTMPMELDANAASARFVTRLYGEDRVLELLHDPGVDGAALRSHVEPAQLETLPERMLMFLAIHSDLCDRFAASEQTSFDQLLDSIWQGSGAIWQRLTTDDALKLPR